MRGNVKAPPEDVEGGGGGSRYLTLRPVGHAPVGMDSLGRKVGYTVQYNIGMYWYVCALCVKRGGKIETLVTLLGTTKANTSLKSSLASKIVGCCCCCCWSGRGLRHDLSHIPPWQIHKLGPLCLQSDWHHLIYPSLPCWAGSNREPMFASQRKLATCCMDQMMKSWVCTLKWVLAN